MFGKWRNCGEAQSNTRPSASEVDAEYSEYRSRVRRVMIRGGLVGGLGTALVYVIAWISGLSAAAKVDNPAITSPRILLAPLPSSASLSGFALLAAVAIALQLAVRTPSEVETRPATVLARRRFLSEFATILVLGSFALVMYTTIPTLVSLPATLDVSRLFGPAVVGLLVAFVAADAGVASDPDFAPSELGRVWRARTSRRLLVGLRMVGANVSVVPTRSIALQAAVLTVAPALAAAGSLLAAPELGPAQRVSLVLLALLVAGAVYAVTISIYLNGLLHEWASVAFTVSLSACVGLVLWLAIGLAMLERKPEDGSSVLSSTLAVEGWAVVYLAVPALLAAWFLAPSSSGQPRAFGWLVRSMLLRRLRRRHVGLEPVSGSKANRLALAAPWVSVLLPFGLILGVIAKQQIRYSRRAPEPEPQRGEWAANLAIALTLVWFALIIGAAFAAASLDLEEWSQFF